jgi:Family of unknown function (DUF5995)
MADRADRVSLRAVEIRPELTPQNALSMLANELEQRTFAFERARDPRCVFACSYARMTRVLAASLPRADFADPPWVAQLALVFAEYYLRALREYDAGTLVRGAWSTVFKAGHDGRTSVLEDLVLSMTAHIVNDLPLALCDVGLITPRGESRIGDYHLLNEVLGWAIDDIQAEVCRRYDPLLGVLDRCAESYDEIATDHGVRVARATAWYNAQRLLHPASRANALAAIARSPEITLQELLEPPVFSVRLVLRGARCVARSSRRWPAAAPHVAGASAFQAIAP